MRSEKLKMIDPEHDFPLVPRRTSPLYLTYMDTPPPNNASLDPPVATDMRGEDERASVGHDIHNEIHTKG